MTHDFRLVFLTNRNEPFAIALPFAEPARTDIEIAQAMERIIDSNVVLSRRGSSPNSRYFAELITTQRSEIDIFSV